MTKKNKEKRFQNVNIKYSSNLVILVRSPHSVVRPNIRCKTFIIKDNSHILGDAAPFSPQALVVSDTWNVHPSPQCSNLSFHSSKLSKATTTFSRRWLPYQFMTLSGLALKLQNISLSLVCSAMFSKEGPQTKPNTCDMRVEIVNHPYRLSTACLWAPLFIILSQN